MALEVTQEQQEVQYPSNRAILKVPTWLRDLIIAAGFGILLGIGILISPYVALALLTGIVVVYIFILHPIRMLYLLLVTIALTSGMPRGRLVPMLIPNEAVLAATFAIALLAFLVAFPKRGIPGMVVAASILLIVGKAFTPVISFYARGWPIGISEIINFFAPLQYLILLWIFATVPSTQAQRERIIQLMIFLVSIVAFIGLLQAMQIPFVITFLNTWYPSGQLDAAEGVGRITSVSGAWNVLGTFMMINLLLLAAIQARPQANKLYLFNQLSSAILSLACLLATGSFASIIGLVFGYIIIKTYEPKGLGSLVPVFLVGILAVILLFPLISTRLAYQFDNNSGTILPQTLVERFSIWSDIYVPLIAKNPIWGVRPTTEGLSWPYAESEYINLLFHSGVVALVAHLGWVAILLRWLRQIIRKGQSLNRSLAIHLYVMLITLSLLAFTNAVFTYSGTIDYLWILLGLTVNLRNEEVREQSASPRT